MAHTNVNPYADSPPDALNYTPDLGTQISSQCIHRVPNTRTPWQNVLVYGPIQFSPRLGALVNIQTTPNTQGGKAYYPTYSSALNVLRQKLNDIRGALPGAG